VPDHPDPARRGGVYGRPPDATQAFAALPDEQPFDPLPYDASAAPPGDPGHDPPPAFPPPPSSRRAKRTRRRTLRVVLLLLLLAGAAAGVVFLRDDVGRLLGR
jgi:hypothetical protein